MMIAASMSTVVLTALMRFTQMNEGQDGLFPTPINSVEVVRLDHPSRPLHTLHKPALIMVFQGRKRMMVSDRVFDYAPLSYALIGVLLPVVGAITNATPDSPYFALKIDLDVGLLHDVRAAIGNELIPTSSPAFGHLIGTIDAPLMDCAMRLVNLITRPHAVAALAPAILRELYYWVSDGPHGSSIAQLVSPNSHSQRIARTIATMKQELTRSVRVPDLAARAGMSLSSFHDHFRRTTFMTPLQYHKRLRLLEARRLMLVDGISAMDAAFTVGYASATQFSREYTRVFGLPPRRDADQRRRL